MGDLVRFTAPLHEGGRHCLLCGSITMGAVFPPGGGGKWVWRLFSFGANQPREGLAKDEQTANGRLLAALVLTLAKAGLAPIATEASNG